MEEQELRLIEGLRNGDEHAYHELFVHHYEVLCHVALQIVGDAFLAESLVNDTIAHLWEIRQSLEIRSLLRAYLMRAVRNRCYNYIALESENREIAFSQKKGIGRNWKQLCSGRGSVRAFVGERTGKRNHLFHQPFR